jgi:hypothetical protein
MVRSTVLYQVLFPSISHTEPDRYSAHRADELFAPVVNTKYLIAPDLRSGYHQIPRHEDSIVKSAFWWSTNTVPPNLLPYQRMPFGLKNAPAKFQRVMDVELAKDSCSDFVFAYIDDLIIALDTWEKHIGHVCKVLKAFEACNRKIHPRKSLFATGVVEYLGHNVDGRHGIIMNDAKVQAIKALPVPINVPELRHILGFMAYYRHYRYSSHGPIDAKGSPILMGTRPKSYTTLKEIIVTTHRP